MKIVSRLTLGALLACQSQPPTRPPVDTALQTCFQEVVTWLADDARQGRGLGTTGLSQSEHWLAKRFETMGLEAPERGVFQPVTVVPSVSLGLGNALSASGKRAIVGVDFMPFGFSASGAFEGPLVFAGYGLTVPRLGYDDYAGLDVSGKVVLAFRHEPGHRQEASPFDGKRAVLDSNLRLRSERAKALGAAALVFVDAPRRPEFEVNVPGLRNAGELRDVGVPVLQVSRRQAEQWLAPAGLRLKTLYDAIEADSQPHSVAVEGVAIVGVVDVQREVMRPNNVMGVWPGSGMLSDETVVIGAHLDHIGFGGLDSLQPGTHAVHPGADDNASGVAAMVCGIEQAMAQGGANRRAVVAVGFAAEETGLWGSKAYVKTPARPLDKTVAMVNLDMVGQVQDHQLLVIGASSRSDWATRLTPAAEASGLLLSFIRRSDGRSDHAPFRWASVPAIHLHSGVHDSYHTPQDTVASLNIEGGGRVSALVGALMREAVHSPLSLARPKSRTGGLSGDRHYAPRGQLGLKVADGVDDQGRAVLRIERVTEGSPADLAGLVVGEVVGSVADALTPTRAHYIYVMSQHGPGDPLCLSVGRGERVRRVCFWVGGKGSVGR
jgi:hypothetical protein